MKKMFITGAAVAALFAVPGSAQLGPRVQAQPLTLAAMEARVQARFARTDANRDGFVTLAEAQAQAVSRPSREQRLANREERQAKRAQRLARFDINRDGRIDQAERHARAAALGGDHAQREARQAQRLERRAQRQALRGARGLNISEQRFARLDADKDNRLSFAEVAARLPTRFQRLDANGDGAVTREERRALREQRQTRRKG